MSSVTAVWPVVATRTDEDGDRVPGEWRGSALPGVAALVPGSPVAVRVCGLDAGSTARAELVQHLHPSAVQ